ncbi:TPA: hypothetical protein TVE67_001190 [Streptococcus equi subsp. zooepidemicus]|nr:hypothetical protein [Streptococcus equi subsp. zooepidemicus]HEL0635979.1 hypothetical protein [Streptococcus equi subsp. zooepidemicus]HEL0652196.1 hypothetical protein [Streptococcus equi subsp. zooepidemicus]HEL0694342.1 hypothetical protein [Streptococcus equi subsp. zooepidemicus]HEL0757768.1 hypothetical protein [Streptococcus equi subsp. zooepidemicus]
MKIYKLLFYITYPALVFSIYLLLDMTSEYGTPLIETVFVAGGFLVIPLLLWSLDIISIESEKGSTDSDKATNKLEQTEA